MVSQNLVEQVMKEINKPCTARDIAEYIRDHNLSTLPSKISWDISNVLNVMRKWEVVDKFPDLHGKDSNRWYLRANGNPHDSDNCPYCKGISRAHHNNTYMHMMQSYNRKVRKVTDEDHLAANEFEITTRKW